MGYRVLIADDEAEIIEFLSLYLKRNGYEILSALDGRSALDILKSQNVDLAIVDIMMPNLNGYEVIKEIRKLKNIPIIILSAKGETYDKVLGLGVGADDYVSKPFDPLEVAARVDANIRRFYNLGAKNIGSKIFMCP